jgi:ubiquinone/menaquinone biosynthesis C-methylase UbiE
VTDPRTELVGRGYDSIGERFAEWRDRIVGDPRREWEDELVSRLQDGARVLELGCGAGVPDTQRLAARFQVTGVDVSAAQVRRARASVPEAEFVHADFTALELEPESFNAVVSFYAFNHVPRELLAPTFARIRRWLVPRGLLMTALGTSDTEAWTGDWLGAPTFFELPARDEHACGRRASRSFGTSSLPSASPMATRCSSGYLRCGSSLLASPKPRRACGCRS